MKLSELFFRILAGTIWATAGFAVFTYLFYTILVKIRHQRHKRLFILAFVSTMTLLPFAAGYSLGLSTWLFMPALFILAFSVKATHKHAMFKKLHKAQPAVETVNKRISLARPLTTFDLAVERYKIKLPIKSSQRLRIAHFSDFHLGRNLPENYYNKVVAAANSLKPDLVFLTGDIMNEDGQLDFLPKVLTPLKANIGAFAVLGNHDLWFGTKRITEELLSIGICPVGARHKIINLEDGTRIAVCGDEGPWNPGKPDIPAEESYDIMLCLTHTPDNIYKLQQYGAAAVFAGHCHAGQVCLPGLGALLIPSIYGKLFERGHFMVADTHLFVSSGVGSGFPGFRFYCQPDVLIVDISNNINDDNNNISPYLSNGD